MNNIISMIYINNISTRRSRFVIQKISKNSLLQSIILIKFATKKWSHMYGLDHVFWQKRFFPHNKTIKKKTNIIVKPLVSLLRSESIKNIMFKPIHISLCSKSKRRYLFKIDISCIYVQTLKNIIQCIFLTISKASSVYIYLGIIIIKDNTIIILLSV